MVLNKPRFVNASLFDFCRAENALLICDLLDPYNYCYVSQSLFALVELSMIYKNEGFKALRSALTLFLLQPSPGMVQCFSADCNHDSESHECKFFRFSKSLITGKDDEDLAGELDSRDG